MAIGRRIALRPPPPSVRFRTKVAVLVVLSQLVSDFRTGLVVRSNRLNMSECEFQTRLDLSYFQDHPELAMAREPQDK